MDGKRQWWQYWGLSLILAGLFSSSAFAGILTGELDKVEGSLDDTFIYTLSIEGSYRQEPGFPEIDGLLVRKGGTSSSFQSINGVTTRRFQVSFYLTPERTGSFEIPALVMAIDGQKQSTLPLTFVVHESSREPVASNDLPFFVERIVSNNELYAGEPIVITDRVYTRVRLMEADLKRDNFPTDFRQLENSDERRYQKQHEGYTYTVIELQTLLVPMKSGEFSIPPLVLNAAYPDPNQTQQQRRPSMFDDLMGRTRLLKRATRSSEQTVLVKSLPAEGRSIQYSGLVGRFQMETKISQRTLQAGDNINLTIRVFGDGLSAGMSEPETQFDSSLRVYNERPVASDQIQGQQVHGEQIFQYTLVPSQAGVIELGTVAIQIFNPQTGTYQWLREDLGAVEVRPRAGQELSSLAETPARVPLPVDRRAVTMLEQDIVDLRHLSDITSQQVMSGRDWLVVTGMGAGGLAFALFGWVKRFMSDTADVRQQRLKQSRAARHFHQTIKSASKLQEPAEFAAQLNRGFREYLRDKSQDGRFLNASQRELQQFFQEKELSHSLLIDMEKLLKDCDRLIYAPLAEASNDAKSLGERFEKLVEELEKSWHGGV